MRLSPLPPTLSSLFLLSLASAQQILSDISFGHSGPLSPNGGNNIPGWQGSSSKHSMQILSDRAILTPPYPGNARGALWAEKTVGNEAWVAEVEFRASGQDSGSGGLNIYYAKEKHPVLTESAYTAGRFDGLVITIDQIGGSGGKIRGFLNDGTQDFRSNSHLESLAFGHCEYAYRNLGRPSRLKIVSQDGLSVEIDGRECFKSDRISLPSGYFFGIVATTAEQPDSFEALKFVVSSAAAHNFEHSQPQQQQHQQQVPQLQKMDRLPHSPEVLPDRPAGEIKNQQEQFGDLHNRLQSLSHQIADVFDELTSLGAKLDDQHDHIMGSEGTGVNIGLNAKIDGLHRRLENVERISEYTRKGYENMERMVEYTRKGYENIEQIVEHMRKDLTAGGYHEHYSRLNDAIDTVTASTPRMGFFIFVVVGVQVALAASYVVYKRRRASMPKKYL